MYTTFLFYAVCAILGILMYTSNRLANIGKQIVNLLTLIAKKQGATKEEIDQALPEKD